MKLIPTWSIEEDHNKQKNTSLIGQIVSRQPYKDIDENLSYILSTAYIIGYNFEAGEDKKFTFTSLADGMTNRYDSIEDIVKTLNEGVYLPVTHSIITKIMGYKVPQQ